jgi:hypothetical protein
MPIRSVKCSEKPLKQRKQPRNEVKKHFRFQYTRSSFDSTVNVWRVDFFSSSHRQTREQQKITSFIFNGIQQAIQRNGIEERKKKKEKNFSVDEDKCHEALLFSR